MTQSSAITADEHAEELQNDGTGALTPKMSRKKMALMVLAAIILTAAFFALSMFVWNDENTLKESLTAFLEQARGSPLALPIVIGCYIGAGFVFFPVALLNLVVAMVFGLWGIVYGLIGVMANTAFFYAIGMVLKRWHGKKWLEHPKVKPVDKKLKQSGLAGMVALHALPAPPFSILNIIAGISSVGATIWFVGTFLAMLPGAISRGVLGEGLMQMIVDPKPESIAYVIGGVVLWIVLVGGAHFLLKKFEKREKHA